MLFQKENQRESEEWTTGMRNWRSEKEKGIGEFKLIDMTTTTDTFSLRLAKSDFKFNAAHFMVTESSREKLHGHNYAVSVRREGAIRWSLFVVGRIIVHTDEANPAGGSERNEYSSLWLRNGLRRGEARCARRVQGIG